MDEISELEGRITAALDRIRIGLDALDGLPAARPAPQPGAAGEEPQDHDALVRALEEERTVNAQLEERVRALRDRQDGRLAGLERRLRDEEARMQEVDRELQALRQTNAELREVTGQLRTALEEGVAEPELVNRAILAELDALRAARAADLVELDTALAELRELMPAADMEGQG